MMKSIYDRFFVSYKKRNKNVWVTKKLNRYLVDLSKARVQNNLLDDYEALMRTPQSSYQTPLNQLELIALLAKQYKAPRILEIGTFKGFTALYLAVELGEHAHVTTCELDEGNSYAAQELWKKHGVQNQITILKGDAATSMGSLSEAYDMIYIDADKQQYPFYYEAAKRLIKKDGLILIDNMLWAGLVAEKKSGYSHATILRQLNKSIYKANHASVSLLPAWDGLLIIRG